jgi:formylglycine-generating enzyme required for sulfatase activity
VFRALAPGGVEVAVKRIFRSLDDNASRRELQSLELIKSLRHPFLLQTQAYWPMEDRLVIVMELADGCLLDWQEECKDKGLPGIPERELLTYFAEAAEALDFLHSRQVLHRDIKPANLLRLGGHAKVADFGLVRLQEGGSMASGTLCGTPHYMAPEAWEQQFSIHTDQYALAVAYAELRRGKPLFTGKNMYEVSIQHMQGTLDLAPLGRAEQAVLRRALARDPHRRYPDCQAFVADLARALAPPSPGPRPRSRWPLAGVGLVILACLGLALGAPWFFRPAGSAAPGGPNPAGDQAPAVTWMPPGFEPEKGAELVPINGKSYLSRIHYPLRDAPLVCLLIRPSHPGDPLPFYIMRDKVARGQLWALLTDARGQELLKRRSDRYPGTVRNSWREEPLSPGSAQLPAVDVTVMEAHCCAARVGGKLPTDLQWVKAGGGRDGAEGPYRPGWKPGGIALGLEGPRPVGTSPDDECPLSGCRDMAGNGRELTGELVEPRQDGTDPFTEPRRAEDWFILRGHSFRRDQPYTFKSALPQSVQHGDPQDDLGFRVVIELPVE